MRKRLIDRWRLWRSKPIDPEVAKAIFAAHMDQHRDLVMAEMENERLLAMDRALYGVSYVKDGKRIDPTQVSFVPAEYLSKCEIDRRFGRQWGDQCDGNGWTIKVPDMYRKNGPPCPGCPACET